MEEARSGPSIGISSSCRQTYVRLRCRDELSAPSASEVGRWVGSPMRLHSGTGMFDATPDLRHALSRIVYRVKVTLLKR